MLLAFEGKVVEDSRAHKTMEKSEFQIRLTMISNEMLPLPLDN